MIAEPITPTIKVRKAPTTSAMTVWELAKEMRARRENELQECFAEISRLAGLRDHRASAAVIHDFIMSKLEKNDIDMVDALLRQVDPRRITSYELTSLLISTRGIAAKLAARSFIRGAAERALQDEHVPPKEIELTLRSL